MGKIVGSRKLIDRMIFALAFSAILLIIVLIFNNIMYMQLSQQVLIPLSENSVTDRVIIRQNKIDFKKFHQFEITSMKTPIQSSAAATLPSDKFRNLHDAIEKLEDYSFDDTSSTTRVKAASGPTLGDLHHMEQNNKATSLELFHMQITANEMYPENSAVVEKLLNDMANLEIQRVEEKTGGTQFKLVIFYRNGMKALFKPKRLEQNQLNPPNQIYFAEYERHNAEIAAFHLDRLLGFRRALPTTGRILNLITEMMNIGDSKLNRTFFKSSKPDENICFTGNCELFCDVDHPICGAADQLEGSFMAFLPDDNLTNWSTFYHPYKRTYYEFKRAEWEINPNYCEKVKEKYPLKDGRDLLDFIDTAVLDFLIGNTDRHNYQTFDAFDQSFHLHYDHGKSFGRPFFDDFSILMPVTQCCVMRSSTLKTLLRYHHGPKPLSMALRESLSNDPIAPVLWEPHLTAIDRRIELILRELRKCITKNSIKNVLIF